MNGPAPCVCKTVNAETDRFPNGNSEPRSQSILQQFAAFTGDAFSEHRPMPLIRSFAGKRQ